jgi:uncharacterized RDD family membrane protein YckC
MTEPDTRERLAPAETDVRGTPVPPAERRPSRFKASLVKRFLAVLVDGLVAGLPSLLLGGVGSLLGTAYILVRDGLDLAFMDRRSIGKRLVGLRVVTLDGSPVTLETSLRRNWMFGLGVFSQVLYHSALLGGLGAWLVGLAGSVLGLVEVVLVFVDEDGRRLGDRIANTQVIESDT